MSDEYVEEEDVDFDPRQAEYSGGDESDESGDEVAKGYERIESTEGGLVKTRTQRAREQQAQRQFRQVAGSSGADVEALWASLQRESGDKLRQSVSAQQTRARLAATDSDMVKIKRTYEYAGELVTEDRLVHRESAEAKAYLKEMKKSDRHKAGAAGAGSGPGPADGAADGASSRLNDRGQPLRKVYRREPLLEGIINGSIKPKFNTLQKSKVDFAKLVDQEGIEHELQQNTKDGYLERQDFLSRVQFTRDSKIKEIRREQLQRPA